MDGFLGNRNVEALAEVDHFVFVELLLLMRDVAAFAGFAESIAFDGFGQDDGGRAFVFHGALVGVVDFLRIVAAALQCEDLFVGHVFHQLEQLGILAEEFFADVGAIFGFEALVLAVHGFAHALNQEASGIAGQKLVPTAAPDHLDDVPAGSAECCFEFRDDLAVAAHRAVQSLQVAVDDEDEVVEFFARSKGDGAERFWFVRLAVA